MIGREKEYTNVSECPFEQDSVAEAIVSPENATVQVPPPRKQKRQYRVWTKDCFHEKLHVPPHVEETIVDVPDESVESAPTEPPAANGEEVADATAEGSEEPMADAKAPEPKTTTKKIVTENGFALQFQGMAREGLAVLLSPKPHLSKFAYEIVLGQQGNMQTTIQRQKESVQRPNRVCMTESWGSYWVCYLPNKVLVGVGETPGEGMVALMDTPERPAPSQPEHAIQYIGLGNASKADRQAPIPLKLRQIQLSPMTEDLRTQLTALTDEDVQLVVQGDLDPATEALWDKYRDDCEKSRARAVKFGVAYAAPPPPQTSMAWSEARKLRANPQQGFITGMDLQDPAEVEKQEKRRQRFGLPAASTTTTTTEGGGDGANVHETSEMQESGNEKALPVGQAWDNESLVRKLRMDPPAALWKNHPPDAETPIEPDEYRMEEEEPPQFVADKIHIFSFDWAAFKQIRTQDIMKHFSIYGPSFVEWMGDLSCNVCFQDQFSAARALNSMSTELPTPAEAAVTSTENGDEKMGEDTTADQTAATTPPDLGNMGWRLGKRLLRKISNDRYGRRGTQARILFRPATSLDILKERPKSWPKPPPGFSTKKILGPGSDHRGKKNKKKKRQREGNDGGNNGNRNGLSSTPRNTADIMSHGLSSTRDGFSIEELEAERAQKRAKRSTENDAAPAES